MKLRIHIHIWAWKIKVAKGERISCNTWCLLSQQIIATTTFGSTQRKEKFNIYHKVSCKSKYVIYLLEYLLCKIQYVRKSEIPFYVRLNNHRKDIKSPRSMEAYKHFDNWDHVFHKHGKFILIKQLNNTKNTSTEVLKQRLKDRENYWIKRLKLTPWLSVLLPFTTVPFLCIWIKCMTLMSLSDVK